MYKRQHLISSALPVTFTKRFPLTGKHQCLIPVQMDPAWLKCVTANAERLWIVDLDPAQRIYDGLYTGEIDPQRVIDFDTKQFFQRCLGRMCTMQSRICLLYTSS